MSRDDPGAPGEGTLRLIARLVPRSQRDEWLAEWRAEVRHAHADGASATRLRIRCLGGLTDALWLRRRHGRLWGGDSHMLMSDLRFAVRSLLRRPALAAIVVSTLALCIGATTAVFSIVESVLLNGLPYQRLDRLAAVWSNNPKETTDRYQVSIGDYYDWRRRSHSFTQLAGFFPIWNTLYGAPGGTERIDVGAVTSNLLPTLGMSPAIGRGFAEGEDQRGAAGTVILTDSFWNRAFQRDPAILGKVLTLDGLPYTVIGVMGETFVFPQNTVDVLMPLSVLGTYIDRREVHMLSVIGRLRDGISIESARREMEPIGKQLEEEHAKEDAGLGVTVKPLTDDLLGDVRRPILVLFGAVCAVLLIGCANVTNLMLARASSRRQEIGVRAAMGAEPGAIMQQLLVESAVIASGSGAIGVLVAWVATRALAGMLPASISQIAHVGMNGYVLAFTLLVSVVVTLLCGTAPALAGARASVRGTIGDGARGSSGRSARRLYRGLVVVELALALVLTVSAGLLINSFSRLTNTDPGFRRDGIVRMKLVLPEQRYPRGAPRNAFYQSLLEQIRALPGVRSAGIVTRFPLHESNLTTSVFVEGLPVPPDGKAPSADLRHAGRDYFGTMGIPFVAGRDFAATDGDSGAAPVIIINQSAAALLQTPDPIGHRISLGSPGRFITVVGVVRDVHDASLREPPRPQVFYDADVSGPTTVSLVVRHDGSSTPIVVSARRIVASIDRTVPVFDVQTIEQVLDKASVGDRFTMLLLSGFSLLALVLAAVGTYGVMAFGVSERTREIGVRMALGARAGDVLSMILREGLVLFGIALPFALGGVWAATRALRGLLFGVGATDPATVALSTLSLAVATMVACYIPARRAARVDPTTAIRGADAL